MVKLPSNGSLKLALAILIKRTNVYNNHCNLTKKIRIPPSQAHDNNVNNEDAAITNLLYNKTKSHKTAT